MYTYLQLLEGDVDILVDVLFMSWQWYVRQDGRKKT